jgi:hypothetical protein
MNKKDILFPFVFLALGGFFLFVSLMVILSKGKSKKWVTQKMKIGGLLLAISAFQNTGHAQQVTCYEPVSINDIRITAEYNNGYNINLKNGNILHGHISGRQSDNFSFSVSDESGRIFQKGEIEPTDGKFDNYSEDFILKLDEKLKEGKYILMLFTKSTKEQGPKNLNQRFDLLIKNE